jgi:hypothetical protein
MSGPHGPYETAEEVRRLPSVRAVYDVMREAPQRGAGAAECEEMILSACGRQRVALGAYDARIVRWLANGDPETCQVIASVIDRAGQPQPGTVTEWALAYTHRPGIPGLPARRVVQPYPSETEAREAVAEVRRLAPEDEPALMRREIGSWRPADKPATGEEVSGNA